VEDRRSNGAQQPHAGESEKKQGTQPRRARRPVGVVTDNERYSQSGEDDRRHIEGPPLTRRRNGTTSYAHPRKIPFVPERPKN
jgi:hypothetical protein